ncbi:MAG TPA: hypothetical protein VGD98_02325 [Ktedonobacteraceae bacterium]
MTPKEVNCLFLRPGIPNAPGISLIPYFHRHVNIRKLITSVIIPTNPARLYLCTGKVYAHVLAAGRLDMPPVKQQTTWLLFRFTNYLGE